MDVLFAPTLFLRRVKSQQIVPPKKCSMLVLGLAILCDMCIHFFAQKILSEPFILYIYIYRQKLLDHFTLHLVSLSSLRVLSNFLFLKSFSQFTPKFSPSSPQASFPCSNPLLCISSAWKSPKRLAAASITLLPSGAHAKRRGKAPGGQDVSICSLA